MFVGLFIKSSGEDFDGTNDPVPDADPMDINGHGTHVAGIIGALAAEPGGVTGVAPAVELVGLKVFGTEGYTWDSIIVSALEMAWEMDVDVVNMSLGDSFAWPQDPSAVASRWLSDQGVMVVASGGNEGDMGEYATGSPAVGSGSVAVASFENIMATRKGFLDSEAQPMGYAPMDYAPDLPASGVSAEVVYCGLGTSDEDFLNPDGTSKVAGKVALISRGAIPFREKSMRAQAHGAVQVIIHNSVAGFFLGTMGQPGDYLPTVSISREDGLRLRDLLDQGPVSLTFTGETYAFTNETAGLMSGFSSWGPAPDLSMKPDLTAPGGSIYSTYPMAQGGYASLSGTSMAAPHAAGAAALVIQARADELAHMGPKARSAAVRALLMNTANPQTIGAGSDQLYPVHRQGAGMIDVFKAVNAQQRIVPDKLSLGEMEANQAVEQRVTVTNTGAETQFYTFELMGEGASLQTQPAMLRLRPGQQAQVRLQITADQALAEGLFYGWVGVRTAAGDLVAQLPYLGYKGDYQAASALDPLDYDLPWLAVLEDGYLYPVEAMEIYPNCDCEQGAAYLIFSLARQAEQLRVVIVNAGTNKVVSEALRADYYPRSGGEIELALFDGASHQGRPLPAGTYYLRLKVLRPLGDKHNPDHWDIWNSGPITLHWD